LRKTAFAQTYVCPPPPEGVYGLPGGPKFAESPPPADTFYSQLDDPRWNGSWREDFATVSSTESGVRMLKEGNFLFISFEGKVDPDGASGAGSTDQVLLGFSADGTTAEMVKIGMTLSPPQTNSVGISTTHWWRTTNGGTTDWAEQSVPLTWAGGSNIHLWSGSGTGPNGDAWAFNAKLDLSAIATHLGATPPLTSFFMWYEIDISTPSATIPYAWPAGTTATFIPDPVNTGKQLVHNMLVSTWGNAYPAMAANCPTGISIDPMHIGTRPETAGIPDTTVHFGTGHPANDFVATMDNGGASIAANTVKARFRIANWGSMIGVGGDWHDMAPTGANAPVNTGLEIDFTCVNPPMTGTVCPQLTPGQPPDQCLLVELSQSSGTGVRFLHDSARRNMDFVNASTFERSAEVSVRGLTPLAGGAGKRDVYLYVRTLNMPEKTNGNPPIQIPPRVPPPPPDAGPPTQDGGPILEAAGRRVSAGAVRSEGGGGAQDAGGSTPLYRMTDYERYASAMPTYEVHVYHDTGVTRTDNGRTVKILEPQAPFGYFVEHQGDLAGWSHELTGEGFVLEQISPNFYRAHVPDSSSVMVHTKIIAREPPKVPAFRCNCDVVGSSGWSSFAVALSGLGVSTLVMRTRRRRRAR
jgi:hypothetical protein